MKPISLSLQASMYTYNIFPNTLTLKVKRRPFFQARQFCHAAIVMSRKAEIAEFQHAVFEQKGYYLAVIYFWKYVLLGVLSVSDNNYI